MPTTVDLVTDFGAPTNGTSDCTSAVVALNTYMLTHADVILMVTAHTYVIANTSVNFASSSGGSTKLVVQATGATFARTGNGVWFMGCANDFGVPGIAGFSARIASATAGDMSVTLLNAGDASLFTAGLYIFISALDLQGFGDPPNPGYFEYVKVASISGTTVNLSTPLKYSYLSTFPLYNAGDGGHPDEGGPATIYAMLAPWDIETEYIGLTIDNGLAPTLAKGRKVTFTNCTCSGAQGIVPTANQDHIWSGCDFSACSPEIDKCVETLTVTNTKINLPVFQSADPNSLIATNMTILTRIDGTPKNATFNGCTIPNLRMGAAAYGTTQNITCNASNIAALNLLGSADNVTSYTCVGGVISRANSSGPIPWAVPGSHCYISGHRTNEFAFTVNSVTQDGTNTHISTTIPGGFPVVTTGPGTGNIFAYPTSTVNFSGCTGCDDVVDLSQAGAQGKIAYSYSKRTYTGGTSAQYLSLVSPTEAQIWGNIVSIKVTVVQSYTGSQSTLILTNWGAAAINPDGTASSWSISVDLKAAPRTILITPASVTGTQGSDSIAVPGNIWFAQGAAPAINHDVSSESSALWPIVTIEVQTDQGFALPVSTTANLLISNAQPIVVRTSRGSIVPNPGSIVVHSVTPTATVHKGPHHQLSLQDMEEAMLIPSTDPQTLPSQSRHKKPVPFVDKSSGKVWPSGGPLPFLAWPLFPGWPTR